MVMGATGVGALFAVGGAVAGAAVGVLAETPARKAAAEATKALQPPLRASGPNETQTIHWWNEQGPFRAPASWQRQGKEPGRLTTSR